MFAEAVKSKMFSTPLIKKKNSFKTKKVEIKSVKG